MASNDVHKIVLMLEEIESIVDNSLMAQKLTSEIQNDLKKLTFEEVLSLIELGYSERVARISEKISNIERVE